MIANETTLYKRPNDTEINNYRSPYGINVFSSMFSYNLAQCHSSEFSLEFSTFVILLV